MNHVAAACRGACLWSCPHSDKERSLQPQKQKFGRRDWSGGTPGPLRWTIRDERLIWVDLLGPDFLPRIGMEERHRGAWGTLSDSCIKNYHGWKGPHATALWQRTGRGVGMAWLQWMPKDQGADPDSQRAKGSSATLTPTRWFHGIICLSVHLQTNK